MKTRLDELQAFAAVVDGGSLTAAAERLQQTVSGLSRALGRLESKLGSTLLSRTTRRLELTEEGAQFLAHARAILAAVEAAEDEMAARRERPGGRLRVNASGPFMQHALLPLLPEFRARYPEIELELNSNDTLIDLIEQRTDIAIRHGRLSDSSLHARLLGRFPMRVLASPAYLKAQGRPRRVADLAQHSLIGFTLPEHLNRWPLHDAERGQDHYEIRPALRASSGEVVRQLALAGQGICCLADFMSAEDRRRGDLVQLLAKETVELLQPINAVYYRNTELAARIRVFLDHLSDGMAAAQIRV